jgi:hypothetical protein
MKHLPETEEKHGNLSLHSWAQYIILKRELHKSATRVISIFLYEISDFHGSGNFNYGQLVHNN